ncbi:hypothetical protein VR44_21800 [Streptomyces katrae]|uniref:Uncharacterized protein n=1 Tax=Streptomyces katrae TaxID=68223 RepID=A0A0F4J7S2_9ACTN|nr:hypothetical protein VR44_21800 [Streptomyces katrae]
MRSAPSAGEWARAWGPGRVRSPAPRPPRSARQRAVPSCRPLVRPPRRRPRPGPRRARGRRG